MRNMTSIELIECLKRFPVLEVACYWDTAPRSKVEEIWVQDGQIVLGSRGDYEQSVRLGATVAVSSYSHQTWGPAVRHVVRSLQEVKGDAQGGDGQSDGGGPSPGP